MKFFISTLLFLVIALAVSRTTQAASLGDFILGGSFNLGATSVSLDDESDTLYLGEMKGSVGVGSHLVAHYKLTPKLAVGGSFLWAYSENCSEIYCMDVFEPSLGPSAQFTFHERISLMAFFHYDIAWAHLEPEQESCSASTCHGGPHNANLRGIKYGVRGLYKINDKLSVGPYATVGKLTLLNLAYKRLDTTVSPSRYQTRGIDIAFDYSEVGLNLFWYP